MKSSRLFTKTFYLLGILAVFLLVTMSPVFIKNKAFANADGCPQTHNNDCTNVGACETCFNKCFEERKGPHQQYIEDKGTYDWVFDYPYNGTSGQEAPYSCAGSAAGCGCTDEIYNHWKDQTKNQACRVCEQRCWILTTGASDEEQLRGACYDLLCNKDADGGDFQTSSGTMKGVRSGPCLDDAWINAYGYSPGHADNKASIPQDMDTKIKYVARDICVTDGAPSCQDRSWDWKCAAYLNDGYNGYTSSPADFGSTEVKTKRLGKCVDDMYAKVKAMSPQDQDAWLKQHLALQIQTAFSFGTVDPFILNPIPGGFGCDKKVVDANGKTHCATQNIDVKSFINDVILIGSVILGGLAIFKIVFGGIMYATAMGSSEKISTAKSHIYYAIIGVVIVLGANIILAILGAGSIFGP